MRKCMTCGAPFEASPKEHICESCHNFFERIKDTECPLRQELVRLMNSQEIAPPTTPHRCPKCMERLATFHDMDTHVCPSTTPQPHAVEAVFNGSCTKCGEPVTAIEERKGSHKCEAAVKVGKYKCKTSGFKHDYASEFAGHKCADLLLSKIARLEAAGGAMAKLLEGEGGRSINNPIANWQSAKQ